MTDANDATLWFGSHCLGSIRAIFSSDSTWFGTFDRTIDSHPEHSARRVFEFIQFCEAWNAQTKSHPADPPDAREFDRYEDLLNSGKWVVQLSSGEIQQVDQAPVFFPGNEITWRTQTMTS